MDKCFTIKEFIPLSRYGFYQILFINKNNVTNLNYIEYIASETLSLFYHSKKYDKNRMSSQCQNFPSKNTNNSKGLVSDETFGYNLFILIGRNHKINFKN